MLCYYFFMKGSKWPIEYFQNPNPNKPIEEIWDDIDAYTFESQFECSNRYMFKLFGNILRKRGVEFDYLQAYAAIRNNFPVDTLAEAQKVQQLISAGLPKKIAFEALSFIDDIDNVMEMIEEEKEEEIANLLDESKK